VGRRRRLGAAAADLVGMPPGVPPPFGDLTVHDADGVKTAVDDCHAPGFDELVFIPVTDDRAELDRLEAALEGRVD
jgi:hypothetical protein